MVEVDRATVATAPQIEFGFLPDDDAYYLMREFGRVLRSRQHRDRFDVECRLLLVDPADMDSRRMESEKEIVVRVPLSAIGLMLPGVIFRRRRPVSQNQRLDRLKFRHWRIDHSVSMETGAWSASNRGTHPLNGPAFMTARRRAPVYLGGVCEQGQIYLPAAEIIRFYFGGLSQLMDDFMSFTTPRAMIEKLVHTDRSGIDENGVAVIAPKGELRDPGSALLLAMILNSSDLFDCWASAVASLRAAMARRSDPFPVCLPPKGSRAMEVAGRDGKVILSPFATPTVFRAWRILSDDRDPGFKRLIIDYGHGEESDDPDAAPEASQPGQPRVRTGLSRNSVLSSTSQPGLGAWRIESMQTSLLRSFPGLAKVKIEGAGPPRQLGTGAPSRRIEAKGLSLLSSGDDRTTAKAVAAPFRSAAQPRPPETLGTERLFEAEGHELMAHRFASEVGWPLATFVSAGRMLQRDMIGSIFGDDPSAPQGMRSILELPAGFGRLARGPGRNRRAAVIRMDLDGYNVYAFELERLSPAEHFSTGLVACPGGDEMGPSQIAAIFKAASERAASHGFAEQAGRSIWPGQWRFRDIISSTLIHTRRRQDRKILATHLVDKACSLAAEDRMAVSSF